MMAITKYFPSIAVWLRLAGILFLELVLSEKITPESIIPVSTGNSEYTDLFWFYASCMVLYSTAFSLILLPVQVLKEIHIHILWAICIACTHFVVFQESKPPSNDSCPSRDSFSLEITEKKVTTFLTQLALCLTACWSMKCSGLFQFLICLIPMTTWIFYLDPDIQVHQMIGTSLMLSLMSCILHVFVRYNLIQMFFEGCYRIHVLRSVIGWRGVIAMAVSEYQFTDIVMWSWITKVVLQSAVNYMKRPTNGELGLNNSSAFVVICFISMVQSTATFISLLGIVVFISRLIKLQFFLIRSWLNGSFTHHAPDPVDIHSASFVDGMTMMVMSLYVEVAEMDVYSRSVFMTYILLTIFSSQIRTIYVIVDTSLIALATVQSGNAWKHLRTCVSALLLIVICVFCSYGVVAYFSKENIFWTLVISHNFVASIALMSGSLCIYLFMLLDSKLNFTFANIDDVTFYVRGSSEFFEFTLTIVVSLFVMSSVYSDVRGIPVTVLLVLYNYFNLVTKGKSGWRAWKMRREATDKVKSLHEATPEEIEAMDDVCSICYQDLNSSSNTEPVRIMGCKHNFHENCLRKWFQIQDKCPICHKDYNFKVGAAETSEKTEELKESENETCVGEDTTGSELDTEDQTVSEGESRSSS